MTRFAELRNKPTTHVEKLFGYKLFFRNELKSTARARLDDVSCFLTWRCTHLDTWWFVIPGVPEFLYSFVNCPVGEFSTV